MPEIKSNLSMAPEPNVVEIDARQLLDWLPVDALLIDGRPCIRWMELRGVPLAEPLFAQTVERQRRTRPLAIEIVTGIEALIQLETICDRVAPGGFIFHTSRCGSTLLANVCRTLGGAIVISEAPVVEKLVSRFFSYSREDAPQRLFNAALLRAAVSALGQRRLGSEQKLFAKFSCVSGLQFRMIKRIWPDVPCVFMYRNPIEVIVSNIANPPEWMQFDAFPAQASAITGLDPDEALKLDDEERCARALARFYAAGHELANQGAMLIDYAELSPSTLLRAIEFFGVTPSLEERESVGQVARIYSKDSTRARRFKDDTLQKRSRATLRARAAAELRAMEPYLKLKTLRSFARERDANE